MPVAIVYSNIPSVLISSEPTIKDSVHWYLERAHENETNLEMQIEQDSNPLTNKTSSKGRVPRGRNGETFECTKLPKSSRFQKVFWNPVRRIGSLIDWNLAAFWILSQRTESHFAVQPLNGIEIS